MKRLSILLLILCTCVVLAPLRLSAQQVHYTVTDLGTLGGTYSYAPAISDSGWVGGQATLPGDMYAHAFLWRNGVMTDLGTLGGFDSWYGWKINIWGDAVGQAETSTPDPLNEDYCGADEICLPFLWRNDLQKMIGLPTLGGNNGLANGVNDFRQVVGWSETATTDPTCPPYLQIMPALWQNGKANTLPVFSGDPDGVAFAINDWGQAVGYSGDCSYTHHALLWQNGKMTNLGSFGGTIHNKAQDINNWGQVVGYSSLTTGAVHAFLWQNGKMTDLGTGEARGLNNVGQIVGNETDAYGDETAYIWQDGATTNLNTLIPSDSGWFLIEADSINDEGQIVGQGELVSTGEFHGFLLTPSYGHAESENATMAASTERPKVNLPENVRKLLERRARFDGLKGGLVTPR